MIPSPLLLVLALGPLALALLRVWGGASLGAVLALDAGLVALAGVDALLAARARVSARRELRPVLSIGRDNLVVLRLRSHAARPLAVAVTDDAFAPAERDGLPGRVALAPGGAASLRYRLRPRRRGAYRLGAITLRFPSPLRLWIRQLRLPARDEVRVYPDVQAVRVYELLARHDRAHAMVRATRRPGGVSEFERLREYTRDDEFRAIDWRATARRQRLIARQYQLERDQSLHLVLDAGRLMTVETQGLPLFDHALNAALLLAHVATRGGDRVGLLAFSDRPLAALAPTAGRGAVTRLVQAVYDVHPELTASDYEAALTRLGHQLRRRTLVVLLTQVHDDVSADALARCVRGLRPRHLPLVILLRDPELEDMARARPDDDAPALYRRAAAAELLGWRDRQVRRLRQLGAHVLDVEPRELTVATVNRYLEIKLRHLL